MESDQLLSIEFSEIDVYLLQLTCGHGRTVFACPTKILDPQSKYSPLELSLSGFKDRKVRTRIT